MFGNDDDVDDDDDDEYVEPNSSVSDLSYEESLDDRDASIPWSNTACRKGDVFYVEPSVNSVTTITVDNTPVELAPDSSNNKSWKNNLKTKLRKTLTKRDINARGNEKNSDEDGIHAVTFQDTAGILKDVVFYVDPQKHIFGRRASLCESLLGIIPGYFSNKVGFSDQRVMVLGFIPGGEAFHSREVKIGDWLKCINNAYVNFDNIGYILSAVQSPSKVKITFQRFAQEAYITQPVYSKNQDTDDIVKFMNGEVMPDVKDLLSKLPNAALFLDLKASENNREDNDVIVYQYPPMQTENESLSGLYLSLSHMFAEVSNSNIKSTLIYCNDAYINVGHHMIDGGVFILAFPAHMVSISVLNRVLTHVLRLLGVLFGNVGTAFRLADNHHQVDHLFALLFQQLSLQDEFSKRNAPFKIQQKALMDLIDGVHWMNLSESHQVEISNALNDLEASDFGDMSDDYYDVRRRYTIYGSCLFHNGYLITSHLSPNDLIDVCLYVRYFCLLSLSMHEFTSQLIVWKEIFRQKGETVTGYAESECRWFLQVVGLRHSLLCVLFESGGCAESAIENPLPDPFYVDQAKATLFHLESIDLHAICKKKQGDSNCPVIADPEKFFPHSKLQREESSAQVEDSTVKTTNVESNIKSAIQPESILKKRDSSPSLSPMKGGVVLDRDSDADSCHSAGSSSLIRNQGYRSSAGSNESMGSGGSNTVFLNPKLGRNLPSIHNFRSKIKCDELSNADVKLTNGFDNVLFYYAQLDTLNGVILSPNTVEYISHGIGQQILNNFNSCCLRIKSTLSVMKKRSKYGREKSGVGQILEYGVQFQCKPVSWTDPKRNPPRMSYWVVGRMILDNEVYLCFHDSISQNIIEMVFQSHFGFKL